MTAYMVLDGDPDKVDANSSYPLRWWVTNLRSGA